MPAWRKKIKIFNTGDTEGGTKEEEDMDFVSGIWFDGARMSSCLQAHWEPKIKLLAKGSGQGWTRSEWRDGQITDRIFSCQIFGIMELAPRVFLKSLIERT